MSPGVELRRRGLRGRNRRHRQPPVPGGELDLEIVHATEGADGIALGPLLAKTGYTTFDQGFVNTASTKMPSPISTGMPAVQRYRGYPIEQLAEKSIVHRGELPADLR